MRQFDFDRDAHPMFDRVFGDHAGIACRAARHHDDFVDLTEDIETDVDLVEHDVALLVEASEQRIRDGFRIFMDLLVHEGRPAALLGRRRVPIDGESLGVVHRIAIEVGDGHARTADAYRLVLPDFHGVLRVGDECGDVGSEEVLALAEPDDQRRIMARADDDIRLTAVDGKDGERTRQHTRDATERFEQVRLAGFLDDDVGDLAEQLRGDFGIGAGGEHVAFGLQVHFQL